MNKEPARNDAAIRYAVVGLGSISQFAVLPAFARARENSRLVALISSDAKKRDALAKKYEAKLGFATDEYDACMRSGDVDAVYIALPNHLHREYTLRALEAGVHVLCEKPMAVSVEDCEVMIRAAEHNGVQLMIGYRSHLDPAHLQTIQLAQSGRIGELRVFNSLFTQAVEPGNVRLSPIEQGGGALYDIGVYCIHAARLAFRAEPEEVFATRINGGDSQRGQWDETTSVVMRFPGQRLAAFTCSFGTGEVSGYQIIGTRGDVRLDPAYEYARALKRVVTVGGERQEQVYAVHDQFAPELVHFSDCIRTRQLPGPSGWQGLADVRVIRAAHESAVHGRPVRLAPVAGR